MNGNDTNQALFERAFESVLESRQQFEAQDREATRSAARILDAARALAERDPETYFGLKPSARDRFLVDALERGAVVLSTLEALAPTDDGLLDTELDITGAAPRRKPVTRGQRKARRRGRRAGTSGNPASSGLKGFIEGLDQSIRKASPLLDRALGFLEGLLGDDEAPQPSEPAAPPKETPGPTGSAQDFFIEEKLYMLAQLEKALEGLERTGTNQPGTGGSAQ